MDAVEKITLVAALALAVVYLWKAYTGARDETIKELKAEIEALRKLLDAKGDAREEN